MKIVVTGAAGFIGSSAAQALLAQGHFVVGIDNLNDYYDVDLKMARLQRLIGSSQFTFARLDIADRDGLNKIVENSQCEVVLHLAAQAGVRYSIENPHAYVDANLVGFMNVLEACRNSRIQHLVFASSSSVYGANKRMPFSEHDNVDHPISLYAATKKANELMAHSYAHLYGLPCTGLRFFTVYGPWGRPDMALFKFTKNILAGISIPVFNRGDMVRDFTYIDDIVEGIVQVIGLIPRPNPEWDAVHCDPATSHAPYRIFNIGNNRPEKLMRYIEVLERCLGRKAILELLPMQAGDVVATMANVTDLESATGFCPRTTIDAGISKFVDWYRSYYEV